VDKKGLMTIVQKYFVMKRFHSFIRQLSGWGFRRLHQTGPDHGCYYHECFLRGIPLLTWLMRRPRPNQGKSTILAQSIEEEPNFYEMRHLHPLPLPPSLHHSSMHPDDEAKSVEIVGSLSAKEYGMSRRASAPTTLSAASREADSKSCPTAVLRLHSYEQRVQHRYSVPGVVAEKFTPRRASTTSLVPSSVSHPHLTLRDFNESNSALPSDQEGFSLQSSIVEGVRMWQREIYQPSSTRVENEIGAQNNKYIGVSSNIILPFPPTVSCTSVATEEAAAAAVDLSSPTYQTLFQLTRTVRCPFDYERNASFPKTNARTPTNSLHPTSRFVAETQNPVANTSSAQEEEDQQTNMQFCQICSTTEHVADPQNF
jgi:hypothetical protein